MHCNAYEQTYSFCNGEDSKLKHPRDQPRRSALKLQETASSTSRQVCCIICSCNNTLISCRKFKRLSIQDRWSKVKQHKLCFIFLTKGHNSNKCFSRGRCWQCGATHHNLLLNDSNRTTSICASRMSPPSSASASSDRSTISTSTEPTVVIVHPPKQQCKVPRIPLNALALASSGSHERRCHVQLDTGAMLSLVTAKLAKTIGARRIRDTAVTITGCWGRDLQPSSRQDCSQISATF